MKPKVFMLHSLRAGNFILRIGDCGPQVQENESWRNVRQTSNVFTKTVLMLNPPAGCPHRYEVKLPALEGQGIRTTFESTNHRR